MAADKSELRTELARLPSRHAAADTESLGFVRSGKHNPTTDGDGSAAQRRVEQLLDRGIEGIQVCMEDGGYRFHPDRSPVTFRGVLECQNIMRTCAAIVKPRAAAAWGYMRTSHVQSVHLPYRVASTGRGTGWDDAVDFRKILGRERNVRGAHILLNVLTRFRAGYRDNEDSRTLSLGHWPRDGELGERGVLPARNGLERRAQPEVLLDIDTLKARQPLANVVRCQFLHFGNLVAQHPTSKHGIGHHCYAKLLGGVDLALLFRIAREQRVLHLQRNERMNGTAAFQRRGRAL